jgi:catechol 2,3-dioxygenase-like lactoylglutathione lyase family enzyme
MAEVKIMIDLYRVIQPVKNIEEAARFYSHVLGTPGERVSPGRHYFICGHTILACYDPITDGDGIGSGWGHHFNQYLAEIYLSPNGGSRSTQRSVRYS